MKPTIKVLAIDQHPLYLQGLLACFKQIPLIAKAETCSNYFELLERLKNDTFNIVFLDLHLANHQYDGFGICRELVSRYKNIFIAVISRNTAPEIIREAYRCGAKAFFDKNMDEDLIHEFLHDFGVGEILEYYVRIKSSTRRSKDYLSAEIVEQICLLTKREREVMNLIVDGLDHQEIEERMAISYDTFKTHRANLLRKLGLKNEVALIRMMIGITQTYSHAEAPAVIHSTPDYASRHWLRQNLG